MPLGFRCTLLLRFVLSLSLSLLLAAPLASAQTDTERARTEFARGVEAYGRAEYQAALDAFQEAYRLAPHPTVRVNIANCYEQLGRPLEALFHFEHFLTEATSASRAQRREVQTAIARLEQRVGQMELHITPDGATVTIDGSITRRAPVLEDVRVEAGTHSVEVTMDGYATARQSVEVPGGGRQRVDVRLERAAVASAAGASGGGGEASTTSGAGTSEGALGGGASTASAGSEGGGESATATTSGGGEMTPGASSGEGGEVVDSGGGDFRITLPVWIAGGVTIAAGIAAAITGGLAISANDDFEYNVAIAQDPGANPADVAQAQVDGQSAADVARTLALTTDVLLITTIIGAGATTFFLITTQEGGLLGDMASASPRFIATPVLSPSTAGVGVSGTF